MCISRKGCALSEARGTSLIGVLRGGNRLTFQEAVRFYERKSNHYPISDCFIKAGYQQTNGGYIAHARKMNVTVNYLDAEPNCARPSEKGMKSARAQTMSEDASPRTRPKQAVPAQAICPKNVGEPAEEMV